MTILNSALRVAALGLFAAALIGCGGGGGSGRGAAPITPTMPMPPPLPPPPPPPPPPGLPTADPSSGFTFDFRLYQQPAVPNAAPSIYERVASGDFNGDGRDDLVASLQGRHELEVFLQQSDGTFAAPLPYTLSTEVYAPWNLLLLADFNNDGAQDIVFDYKDASGTNSMVMLASQPGTNPPFVRRELTSMNTYVEAGAGASADLALDLTGDGNVDLVEFHNWKTDEFNESTCTPNQSCPHVVVYAGDGQGGIAAPQYFPWKGLPHAGARDFFVQDIDMDGLADVVLRTVYGYPQQTKLYAMKRKPDGSVSDPALLVDMNAIDAPPFFADLNGDARTDVIYGDVVHFREPSGAFRAPVLLGVRYNMADYWNVLADFDGNGQVDLVNHQFESFTNNLPYFVTYLQKDGQLQTPFYRYDPPTSHLVSPDKWGRQAAAVGDFNGDGCRDIVVAARYTGLLFLEGRNCIRAAR